MNSLKDSGKILNLGKKEKPGLNQRRRNSKTK